MQKEKDKKRKFAIPTTNGQLSPHFGHCHAFTIIEIEDNRIISQENLTPPAHQPGSYPGFLADLGVETVIAGGMGEKAQHIFAEHNIEVRAGVSKESPQELIGMYLNGQLLEAANSCGH